MDQLEVLHQMRRAGTRFPLMRGDGARFGWYAIDRISEQHSQIGHDGVGFVVRVSISMTKTQATEGAGQQIITGLLSLFGALGR